MAVIMVGRSTSGEMEASKLAIDAAIKAIMAHIPPFGVDKTPGMELPMEMMRPVKR
jgi:hypothetical protein